MALTYFNLRSECTLCNAKRLLHVILAPQGTKKEEDFRENAEITYFWRITYFSENMLRRISEKRTISDLRNFEPYHIGPPTLTYRSPNRTPICYLQYVRKFSLATSLDRILGDHQL